MEPPGDVPGAPARLHRMVDGGAPLGHRRLAVAPDHREALAEQRHRPAAAFTPPQQLAAERSNAIAVDRPECDICQAASVLERLICDPPYPAVPRDLHLASDRR